MNVLPPSEHRSGRYDWRDGLPDSPDAFPLIAPHAAGLCPPPDTPSTAGRITQRKEGGLQSREDTRETRNELCLTTTPPRISEAGVDDRCWEAVTRCQPVRVGERNDCLWRLVGRLKLVSPEWTGGEWYPVVRRWWEQAHPVIGTKCWGVSWCDFLRGWQTWDERKAGRLRLVLANAVGDLDGPERRLRVVCGRLAQMSDGGEFYLSARFAADALGVSPATANRHLLAAVRDGWLVRTSAGTRSAKLRQAASYRLSH